MMNKYRLKRRIWGLYTHLESMCFGCVLKVLLHEFYEDDIHPQKQVPPAISAIHPNISSNNNNNK